MCNNKRYSVVKNTLLVIAFLLSFKGFAHGDLSIKIQEKTKEILKTPKDFKLYYQRGLLYQQHIEYAKALKDYNSSKVLGNTNRVLQYRMAEVNYLAMDYELALIKVKLYLESGEGDVKGKKLEAQILFNLEQYKKALKSYRFVINKMIDLRPEDIIEYCNIILAENNKNFKGALEAIEIGLNQLGPKTLSLQLKKLEYLEDSNQTQKVLKQYNYFILEYYRNEFWYFKKAKYLVKINKPEEAKIALKLTAIAIEQLDEKFKNMNSRRKIQKEIKKLYNEINNSEL
ncbi:lipopolysaccharide assembly protein LapB [Algibacter sp. L4_22]|uniref:tetratricopeptide repeat protein n=1 Tax=Algibacter sp. L4_22 TaxID=2942477 RepID=UPI00201B6D2B|nr:hypothetical protein [Algibacter sp. L4_22]MCL5129270.1 hypothetical protein [Algibacter sp. L4_22]